MKQKIKVVLARSAWDGGETAWKEHKIVEIGGLTYDKRTNTKKY